MSQGEEAVKVVDDDAENVDEDVPKYVKDRQRRQFLAEMAVQYPEGTFAQISELCGKPCGKNFKLNPQNYSVFLFGQLLMVAQLSHPDEALPVASLSNTDALKVCFALSAFPSTKQEQKNASIPTPPKFLS